MNLSGVFLLMVFLAVLFWCVISNNRFVIMRNRCINARPPVDVELKRRHDVVPRLADTVKGFALHEKQVLENLAKARTEAMRATSIPGRIVSEKDLSSAIVSLFAVAEGYPDLKADGNFLRLHDELARIEDRIRFSRQFYNDSVMRYNTLISIFPNNGLAVLLRFGNEPYFDIDAGPAQPTGHPVV